MLNTTYDIIVVGAGHAGCEASHAAAQMGASVLLITMDMTKMAQMSCNPAMGGIAKGQIIKEIDALGGMSGIITDLSMIQFRMLNRSKGPAVWSPRAQCDRMVFSSEWRKVIERNHNIRIWQDTVTELKIKKGSVCGVRTTMGADFRSKAVILTTGTFGNGLMHVGKVKMNGGRISEPSSEGLTEQLIQMGLQSGRMKTGTPARLDARSINFNMMEEQHGDNDIRRFSYLETRLPEKQLSCFITYTNEEVHHELRKGFNDSPLYNGTIQSIGPRYCPSIETKLVTFSERDKHQLFLEPEGWDTAEYYLNGFSSSLSLETQYKALRKIRGLEHVQLFRPGYAIEYDYYPPTQLKHSLETKVIENLYMAGQVNGTTGYEEAAAQGLMAGINAVLKISGADDFVLRRDEAYIGVLIDDLVTKGVDEPYRMFTSRAEYRILLRQDNADFRLSPKAIELGIASKERERKFLERIKKRDQLIKQLKELSISPEDANMLLCHKGTNAIRQKVKYGELLLRPQISIFDLISLLFKQQPSLFVDYDNDLLEAVEIEFKYNGYIERERLLAEKMGRLDGIRIDQGIDFDSLLSISTEGRFKLKKYQPKTLGEATRISGISPSDINVLLLYMGR